MRSLPLFLIPTLALAFKGASVPVPLDPAGRAPSLAKAAVLDDGTWTVTDTSGRVWWSVDLGAHWDSVVAPPNGAHAETFGTAVVASDEKSVWTRTEGWRGTVRPEACTKGLNKVTLSDGWLGIYDSSQNKVTYCQSSDGLRTWTVWFSPPTSSLPEDTLRWIGKRWNNKIWHFIPDSGYMRGTSDGLHWTRINVPGIMQSFDFSPVTRNGSELVIFGGKSFWFPRYVASSSDDGATWSVQPMSEPGHVVRKITDHLFFTATYDSLRGRGYGVSPFQTGPWTLFDTAYRGTLAQGDDVFLVEERSIWKVVFEGVGSLPRSGGDAWRVVRLPDRVTVELPGSMDGSLWSLQSLDGRELSSGRIGNGRLELPLGPSSGILRVGPQARILPRL